jgi:ElaB/YqjD/DUF883 family membrane-anchored ribosome-binding protein
MQNNDPYKFDDSAPTGSSTDTTLGNRATTAVADAGHEMREKMDQMAQSAKSKVEQGRRSTAGALDRAADALHRKAESIPGGRKASEFAHTTADKLQDTAHYLREHDFRDMMDDVESVVRRRPGQALLGALAVGFLVGRSMRKQY